MSVIKSPLIVDIDQPWLSDEDRALLVNPLVGGLILFGKNFSDRIQLEGLISEIRGLNSSLLICVDQEGGRVQRFREGFSVLPAMQSLGAHFRKDRTEALQWSRSLGWLMASELLSVGVDLSFAPVLDVDSVGSDVIGDRAYSSDPLEVTVLARAFVSGMETAGMCATGKHFPGHGGVKADSHLELPVDPRTLAALQQKDIIPFAELLPDLAGIMLAHIVFPSVDDRPVGFSSVWIKHVLREQLGFRGIVFSDDLSMQGAATIGGYSARAEAALAAGCDAILVCNNRAATMEVLAYLELHLHKYDCRSLQSLRGKDFIKPVSEGDEQHALYLTSQKALNNLL